MRLRARLLCIKQTKIGKDVGGEQKEKEKEIFFDFGQNYAIMYA